MDNLNELKNDLESLTRKINSINIEDAAFEAKLMHMDFDDLVKLQKRIIDLMEAKYDLACEY